jgi:hypothetical protein
MKNILFCKHAEAKFRILKGHGFVVSKKQVLDTLNAPDKIEKGRNARHIYQKIIDKEHVLRVVCERRNEKTLIITFYPGRRNYYEN